MGDSQRTDFRKTIVSVTGLLALLAILILLNVILSHANIRWDTTEGNVYSLSEGTKNILNDLTEPVTIEFFYSRSNRSLPTNVKLYAKRVRDFLSEYEHRSRGSIRVEERDPKPDSDEEEWAQKYGMQGMQVPGGDPIYCGLVFLSGEQEERIPWLDSSREELLEYDITRIIHRFQRPEKKVVGILSTLPVFGMPQGAGAPGQTFRGRPWFFITEMQKTYEVRPIDLGTDRIDPSIDLLFILHPKDISAKVQYAIDQYVLSGGNALIFVDPFCISDPTQGQQRFMVPSGSDLDKLFQAWGITMESGKCLADLDQPTRVRTRENALEDNPVWISARGDSLNHSDVVTSQLESMLFPVAGAIRKAEGTGYGFESLVQSGKNAALIDVFKASFGAAAIRRDFVSAEGHFNIAIRVQGKFKTAFPAGPPKDEKSDSDSKDKMDEGAAQEATQSPEEVHFQEGKETSSIIVVADADLLADEFYVQRGRVLGFSVSQVFNDNLNFLLNSSEVLTGSDDLVGLRSRGRYERPFTAVLELERQAQERWLAKEKELMRRAEETNRKLQELQQRKDSSQRLILSQEQEAEIAKFRDEKTRINRELKEVRKNLRADIEALGTILKWINIFLMPLCISLAGVGFAIHRQRKMKKR